MSFDRIITAKIAALTSAALIALPPAPVAPLAHAQALQPVVDVCTGITLPRSALTQVIGAINQPIVDQIETTVNGLTTVTLILAPLATIPDLNIDLSTILANASAGAPISLQILDTNGNVVTASDSCNITADNYTLTTPKGISIGGNRISGLGADGPVANAGDLSAIALGNNASTAVGAPNAVAIGTNASATAANSVALGAGSLADRGAVAGYTAPGVVGTFNSAGSVSVGSAGALRQITNVAPGTAASDAATVGQVNGALTAVSTLDALAIKYNDTTRASATLGGASGTTIGNLAPGAVTATSTEAINGSQLFATNGQVAANTGAITNLTTTVNGNTTAITNLQAGVTANTGAITALDSAAVKYDDPSHTVVTFNGAGGTRLTNVAPGAVTATSTDAVNGSQLAATNAALAATQGQVAANTGAIAALDTRVGTVEAGLATNTAAIGTLQTGQAANTAAITTLQTGQAANTAAIAGLDARVGVTETALADTVRYDNPAHTSITLTGAAGTTIGNVAAGALTATSRDAVNGSQLNATNGQVAANTGAIAGLDTRVTGNTNSITNLDGRVTTNTTAIAGVQQQLANLPVGYVSDADKTTPSATPTTTVAVKAAGGGTATLTNVRAGALTATSTDAVNGAQLAATNAQVTANTTAITTLSTTLAGAPLSPVQYSNPAAPTTPNGGVITNDVTLVGANGVAPVRFHNVANGTLANDAVNLGQLQGGLASVMSSSTSYTDQRFSILDAGLQQVKFDLRDARRDAFAGTASALAVAGIPQTMDPTKTMFGGAVGHYRGQTAFAIGASRATNDGGAVFKAGATIDTHGKGGFSAGAGFAF